MDKFRKLFSRMLKICEDIYIKVDLQYNKHITRIKGMLIVTSGKGYIESQAYLYDREIRNIRHLVVWEHPEIDNDQVDLITDIHFDDRNQEVQIQLIIGRGKYARVLKYKRKLRWKR